MTKDVVKQIRKATKRKFTADEKIRIVLEGLRGDHVGQLDNLIRLGVCTRHVDQAGRHAPRSVTHRLIDQALHAFHFFCRGDAGSAAHGRTSHGAVRHQVDYVGAGGVLVDLFEVFAHVDVTSAAVARYYGRAALNKIIEVDACLRCDDRIIAVGVQVDESRSDDQPFAVDDATDLLDREPSDRDDPFTSNGDVADLAVCLRAVVDCAGPQQQVDVDCKAGDRASK